MKTTWVATTGDRVRHAHRTRETRYGERVCRPGYQVMDPAFWLRTVKQPRTKCKRCEAATRRNRG